VKLVCEWTLNLDSAQHSERLMWSIDKVLQASGWKVQDVDVFGVGIGPGSFTGLRIGITTARTLAHTLKKPLIGVSSLAALARPAASWLSGITEKPLIVAATDACKGELFALWGPVDAVAKCAVRAEGGLSGHWDAAVEEQVLRPAELMPLLSVALGNEGTWLAIGEGSERYSEAWAKLPEHRRILMPLPFSQGVQGRSVAMLAWEAYQSGQARSALQVHPRYLRSSDAEIKLKAGLLPKLPSS
jgi:tRNA threonylcarbamoyladenosine biosynthesis protein TsaB